MNRVLLYMLAVLGWFSFASAQYSEISGRVIDAKTGKPLVAAAVYIEEKGYGVYTDENGYFFIPRVPPGTYTLKAEYVGYVPYDLVVEVDSTKEVVIKMEPILYIKPDNLIVNIVNVGKNVGKLIVNVGKAIVKVIDFIFSIDYYYTIGYSSDSDIPDIIDRAFIFAILSRLPVPPPIETLYYLTWKVEENGFELPEEIEVLNLDDAIFGKGEKRYYPWLNVLYYLMLCCPQGVEEYYDYLKSYLEYLLKKKEYLKEALEALKEKEDRKKVKQFVNEKLRKIENLNKKRVVNLINFSNRKVMEGAKEFGIPPNKVGKVVEYLNKEIKDIKEILDKL